MIPSEESIHKLYSNIQQSRTDAIQRARRVSQAKNPDPIVGRQAYHSNQSRFTDYSFRSKYFNTGIGLTTLAVGETKVVAQKMVPAQHAGVLTGFSQYFAGCSAEPDISNSVTWGIRINGGIPFDFQDFVGEFSTLASPHAVYFTLAGGAETLGAPSVSPGGSIAYNNTVTVMFRATNNWKQAVVLQGRLIGYTFPVAERNDEFTSI